MPAYGLREHGRLYGHGLNAFGLDPARLILVETAHRKETLWALEEALHSGAPAAVAGVIDQLDLKRAKGCNSPPPIAVCRCCCCGRREIWNRARRPRAGASAPPKPRATASACSRGRDGICNLNAVATDGRANGWWSTIMSRIVSVWLPRWPILRFLAAQAKNPLRQAG